jgi:hypothetical protein
MQLKHGILDWKVRSVTKNITKLWYWQKSVVGWAEKTIETTSLKN